MEEIKLLNIEYDGFIESFEGVDFTIFDWAMLSINLSNVFTVKENTVKYNQTGKFEHVLVNDSFFAAADFNLRSNIKKALIAEIGKHYTLIESNQEVYLDETFSKEYAFSKYSKSLSPKDMALKGDLIMAINFLINYASSRKHQRAKHNTHSIDAAYGFYKYKTTYKDYYGKIRKAVLVIRNDKDGKKYIYDIFI